MIEQRVTLRYDAQQIPAIVQAVQGDTGRDVIFELADYEIPAGATANYYIDKPDGNAVYNSAEVISSTEILAHLTEQALAAPGRNNGQVRILSDGEVITSFDFVLEVEAFRGILRLQSETEVNIFDEALQAAAEEAIQEILDQTPVVTGMQNSIAPTYSSSSTYAVGDYVMYNAQLYRCITAITTAEAWTAAHWTQVPLANDVNDLKQNLSASRKYTDQSIDYVKDNIFPVAFTVENGDIDGETGADVSPASTARLRTVGYIDGDVAFYTMNIDNKPYKYRVFFYDSNKTFVSATGYYGDTYDANINPDHYPYIRLLFLDYTGNKWNNPINPTAISNFGLYKDENTFVYTNDSRLEDLPFCTLSANNATIASVYNKNKTFKDGLNVGFDEIDITSGGKTWESLTIHIENPVAGGKVHFHYEKTPSTYRAARINYYANNTLVEGDVISDSDDVFAVLPGRNDIEYVNIIVYLSNGTAGTLGSTYELVNVLFEYYNDGILDQYPSYFMTDILANLKYHGDTYNGDNSLTPLILAHFSDVHASVPALVRLKTFKDTYGEYIDDVIHTGDAVKSVWENGYTFWDDSNAGGFLNVIGNHDCWTWGDSYTKAYTRAYSAKQCYDRYIAPYVSEWGAEYVVDKCYYYKDYPDSNIRLIVIDNMHWKERVILSDNTVAYVYKDGQSTDTGQQKTWLESVLADALENELSVICATHYPARRTPINSTFMSLNAYSVGELQTEIIQTVQDFIEDGGEFIAWICGHNHEDLFGTIIDYPNQLMIAITDSEIGSTESNVIHLPNTYGETNVNIFSIDPNHKYVRLMRIGSDFDRHGRHIGSLVYDYENHTLIYN